MTAKTIGSITADAWKGAVNPPQKSGEIIERAGVSTIGFRQAPARPVPSQVQTTHLGTTETLATLRTTALDMQATVQSVTGPNGTAYAHSLITEVKAGPVMGAKSGDTVTACLVITWTFYANT